MNRRKFIGHWVLVTGVIIALIGLIHNSFTPMMYQQMLKDEAVKNKAAGFAYLFAFCGFAILFAGLLKIYSSFSLKKSEKWAWIIAISASLFVALGGIGAITFAKFTNSMIYIMCVSAVSNVFLLLIFHREYLGP